MAISLTVSGQNGPAGVGSQASNPLWLKATDLTSLTTGQKVNIPWPDASGNGNSASQLTAGYQPNYFIGVVNGKPVVRFDGTDDFFVDSHSYTARNVFVVYRMSSVSQNPNHLAQAWGNYTDGAHVAMDARVGNLQGFSFDGTPINVNRARYGINGTTYTAFTANTNIQPWQYDNFEIVSVEFEANRAMTAQVIGSLYSSSFPVVGTHQFGGDIAEIIVFNNQLNLAERVIVENYLSSKYGISISGAGVDYYSKESTHSYGVTGIGRRLMFFRRN